MNRCAAVIIACLTVVLGSTGAVRAADSVENVARCTGCHGEGGNARTPGMPSLAGQRPLYLVSAMHQYQDGTRASKAMKPVAAPLDEKQLRALSVYFASQQPIARKTTMQADIEAGRLASAGCASCHGSDGTSMDVVVPSLAGQDATYLVARIDGYRGKTGHWGMPHQVIDLSGQGARNVAVFFASQTPRIATGHATSVQAMASRCDRCHDAPSATTPTPRLAGKDRAYLASVLRAYRDGTRANSAMHRMTAEYSDAAIDELAGWYATAARK